MTRMIQFNLIHLILGQLDEVSSQVCDADLSLTPGDYGAEDKFEKLDTQQI